MWLPEVVVAVAATAAAVVAEPVAFVVVQLIVVVYAEASWQSYQRIAAVPVADLAEAVVESVQVKNLDFPAGLEDSADLRIYHDLATVVPAVPVVWGWHFVVWVKPRSSVTNCQ